MENTNLCFANEILAFLGLSVIIAWFTSQLFKAILNCAISKRAEIKYFFKCFFSDGDFPSSHTCFSVTSLIVSIPYLEDVINNANSTTGDVTFCRLLEILWILFVFVIVKDAIGVRGSLKKLSSVVKTFLSKPEDFLNDSVNSELQSFWTSIANKININVGHMPHEVIGGLILALVIGIGANAIRLNLQLLLVIDIAIAIIYFISTFYILTHKEICIKRFKNFCNLFSRNKD